MRFRLIPRLTALTLAAACASAPATPRAEQRSGADRPITAEEIQRSQAPDLLTAVQVLRPQWLARHRRQSVSGADGITVYLNGNRLGGVAELRSLSAQSATSVRFLTPAQAQFRYGSGNTNGAIEVVSTQVGGR